MQGHESLTYQQSMSRSEAKKVLKDVGIPIFVFILAVFTISNYAAFGTKLLCPMVGAVWTLGVIVAFLIPVQRKEVLNQTLGFCALYCLALLGLKVMLSVLSGVSNEMIAASYNQALPTSTGNTFTGYIQNFIWYVAVLSPIGEIAMQVKRLVQFRKTQSITKTFQQERGIRRTRNER